MSQADELMKGFQIGRQNSPYAPLGNAIRDTISRLNKRDDMANQMVTQAGITRMFEDPNKKALTKAKLDQTQANTGLLSAQTQWLSGSGQDNVVTQNSTRPSSISAGFNNTGVSPQGTMPTEDITGIPQTEYSRAEGSMAGKAFGQTPKSKIEQDIAKDIIRKKVEKLFQASGGRSMSVGNFENLVGVISELDATLTRGHRAGQMGSIFATAKADIARKIGGSMEDKYAGESADYRGRVTETLLKMMPMLTQQGDQPGSVRLVKTIFEELRLTIPEEKSGLSSARRELAGSLKSFYRFARSAQLKGIRFEDEFGDINTVSQEDMTSWVRKIKKIASNVTISGEEEEAFNAILAIALKNSSKLMKERGKDQSNIFSKNKTEESPFGSDESSMSDEEAYEIYLSAQGG